MSLADANYCDSLSCQLEQRLGLRMSYNYEKRQLHISRTDSPRTTLERIKHRLESGPHLRQQRSTDYDPITGSWVTIAVSTMPHQKG